MNARRERGGSSKRLENSQPALHDPISARNRRLFYSLVLTTRGLALIDTQRTRVENCADLATLTGWLQRAVLALTSDDVFG